MSERRALELAAGICRQHNLLSTATEEERESNNAAGVLGFPRGSP